MSEFQWIAKQGSTGHITFSAGDVFPANWARINGDGSFEHGEDYDVKQLAGLVAQVMPRGCPVEFEADGVCFTITADGNLAFHNWNPPEDAAEFLDALARAYADVMGGRK